MRIKIFILSVFLVGFSLISLFAQSGGIYPTNYSVRVCQVVTYNFNYAGGANISWGASNGHVVPNSATSTGGSYSVSIHWDSESSSANVAVMVDHVQVGDMRNIVVGPATCVIPDTPNGVISATPATSNCGKGTLSYSGNPPTDVTWFWQIAPDGKLTTHPERDFTVYDGGTYTYYLRAKSNCVDDCWSPGYIQKSITVYDVPVVPARPTPFNNACSTRILTHSSPPVGVNVNWYWQTSDLGVATDQIAAATNYTVPGTGSAPVWVYLRAKNSYCWSDHSANIYFTPVDPPVPGNAAYATPFCDWETPTLTTTGYPSNGTMLWYNSAGSTLLYTGINYSNDYLAGSYSFKVKAITYDGCMSTTAATVSMSVTANCGDTKLNNTESTVYSNALQQDGSPTPIALSKQYFNATGKLLQSQTKSIATTQVFASEPIDDSNNIPVITTLSAPINSTSFGYRHKFVTDDVNKKYNATDFDAAGTSTGSVNKPKPVANGGPGTLGWYYSNSNTLEPLTPTTVYPYARSYSPPGPNPTTSRSAGPGDQNKMGGGHEVSVVRTKFSKGELSHYLKLRDYFLPGSNETDAGPGVWPIGGSTGNITVTPGTTYAFRVKGYCTADAASLYVGNRTLGIDLLWPGPQLPKTEGYVEATFTVPLQCSDIYVGVKWNKGTPGSAFTVTESSIRQVSGTVQNVYSFGSTMGYKVVTTNADGQQGVSYIDVLGNELATATIVNGVYDNWSYSYYNDFGQLIATVAPNGVNTSSTDAPKFVTLYKYDHLGRLIETTDTDKGKSQFVYSLDGKLKFSQNAEQKIGSRFSYINYDNLGRTIESGEYTTDINDATSYVFQLQDGTTPVTSSVLNLVDDVGFVNLSRKVDAKITRYSDYSYIEYDVAGSGFVPDNDANHPHPAQTYLFGRVSKTENENASTWYSYNEFGKLNWTMQYIPFGPSSTSAVQWTNIVNCTFNAGILTKTSGVNNSWDTGASSIQSLPINTDGWIDFNAGEITTNKMMGLSGSDPNVGYGQINYAIYATAQGSLTIYENGTPVVSNVTTYLPSDILRIERVGSNILYKKNGANIYTSLVPTNAKLYADCSIYTSAGSFKNISLGVKQSTGFKTIDYSYDYIGNLTQVAYQKGYSDSFYHYYLYDADQRLTAVYTNATGTAPVTSGSSQSTPDAKYFYYLHGPLKRVELGGNIQGIDYVYNIDGSLKLINNADPSLDPGLDGISGANAGFQKDIFGETLDYNANDYAGAGYNEGDINISSSTYPEQYGGKIKVARWHSAVDSHVMRAYAYQYDNLNQLDNADWGNITSGTYSFTPAAAHAYEEDVNGYDKNGNIQGMIRKGKTGNSLANYSYTYTANTNKLAQVTGGTAPITYQYNNIGQMTNQTEGAKSLIVTYNAKGLVKEVRNATNYLLTSYQYDDRGNRFGKTVYDGTSANTVVKQTYYVHNVGKTTMAVYETVQGVLTPIEFPIYGKGRVAINKPLVTTTFYEVSDHLGNVRGVVGKPTLLTYRATLEDNGNADINNPRVQELAYFKQLSQTAYSDDRMNHTPASLYTPSAAVPAPKYSAYLSWTDPAQKSMGPSINLKVEAGDKVDISAWAKFRKSGAGTYGRPGIASAFTSILANNYVGSVPGIDNLTNASTVFQSGVGNLLGTGGTGNDGNSLPYAYVYYILYDRSFNYTTKGWCRVPASAGFSSGSESVSYPAQLTIPQLTIAEPGYLYVFVANESPSTDVWFDDLTIDHQRSSIVAGADFYPFGLTMENREITREDYRYGYQGQYAEKDKTTGWNEFELRMYDARIGRWTSVDPYGQYASPYIGMGNNPVSRIDPNGGLDIIDPAVRAAIQAGAVMLPDVFLIPNLLIAATDITESVVRNTVTFTGIFWGAAQTVTGHYKPLTFDGDCFCMVKFADPQQSTAATRAAEGTGLLIVESSAAATVGVIAEPLIPVVSSAFGGGAVTLEAATEAEAVIEESTIAAEETAVNGRVLTNSESRAIKSYENQIVEHEKKLIEFKKDPTKFDNKNFLRDAPSDEVRQRIIESRIKHLTKEIDTFKANIKKILDGI